VENWTVQYWSRLLNLAEKYGWRAKGTKNPENWDDGKEWDGNYWWNSGQTIEDDDAKLLAVALKKALEKIPDEENKQASKNYQEMINWKKYDGSIPLEDIFSGKNSKQCIQKFIEFCEKGGFEIS